VLAGFIAAGTLLIAAIDPFVMKMPVSLPMLLIGVFAAGCGFFALGIATVWFLTGLLGSSRRREASRYFMLWTVTAAAAVEVALNLPLFVLLQLGFGTASLVLTLAMGATVGAIGWNWIDRRHGVRFSQPERAALIGLTPPSP
jgi:hypothetical protein